MLRLRPYKSCDADTILSWCKDAVSFYWWTSDRYDHYPITAEDMNRKYVGNNGDCSESDNFYPMTLVDDRDVVGHLILRYTDSNPEHIRFGFVIVDDSRRGKGLGKQMLQLALQYAFQILKAKKVSLGVFENNLAAYHCYKAVGFRTLPMESSSEVIILGEKIPILELEMTVQEFENYK